MRKTNGRQYGMLLAALVAVLGVSSCANKESSVDTTGNVTETAAAQQEVDAVGESESVETEITQDFRDLVSEEISRQAAELMTRKEEWFADYNGEKVQVISDSDTYYMSSAVAFYRADEGETLEEIVTHLVDALMEPYFSPREGTDYLVTDYFLDIENQLIYDQEEVTDIVAEYVGLYWNDYRAASEKTDQELMSELISLASDQGLPIGEDVWLLPYLNTYTKYEGQDFFSWEEYVAMSGDQMKDGCMPTFREGSGGSFHYILIRDGSVYRLQNADSMGYKWLGLTGGSNALGGEADDTDMVQFEMTKSIYDLQLHSVEKTADNQYVLSGVKYYPDIVLTDEEYEQLEVVGLLCGFLDGEEMFQITKVDGTYQFAWGDEAAYEIQFVQKSFSAWEDGWVMGSADSSNPIGWHSYGPLDEAFKLTVPADQIIVSDGVRTQSWGITGETLTVKDLYEVYTGYGNKWSQDGEESVGLRIDAETDGIQMEIIYRP